MLDHLSDAGLVDKERVAYTGLSAGANRIDIVLANGIEMAAAITSTCCSSPELVFANPHRLWRNELWEYLDLGNPLRDADYREKFRWWSPDLNVSNIDAAILANVAEHEYGGFKPLLAWMRELHKPMEVFTYAGEYHMKTKPSHRAAIYRRNIDWLQFWLQGVKNPDPVDPEQYVRWRAMREERDLARAISAIER